MIKYLFEFVYTFSIILVINTLNVDPEWIKIQLIPFFVLFCHGHIAMVLLLNRY